MKRHISVFLLLLILLGFPGCNTVAPDTGFIPDIPTVESTDRATEEPVTEPTFTEMVHIHYFSDATCTDPGRCDCGETDGKALGHVWSAATCLAPKTCAACGKTEGKTASHNYANGTCAVCGKKEPGSSSDDMVWIPTKGGKKYHAKESCSKMIDPDKVTKSEAEDLGFDPCKRCYK